MTTVQDEFRARLERDVARIMRHIVGSEMNPTLLDGEIVLKIENGALVDVKFGDSEPDAPKSKGKGKNKQWMGDVDVKPDGDNPASG